jgi:hypothetical protein
MVPVDDAAEKTPHPSPIPNADTSGASKPSASPTDTTAPDAPKLTGATPNALTPEEQMERFAEELKEQDWGHQPC